MTFLRLIDSSGVVYSGIWARENVQIFSQEVGACPSECSILSMNHYLENGSFFTNDDNNLRIHSENGDVRSEFLHKGLDSYIYMKRFETIATNGGGECRIWSLRKYKERIKNSKFIPKFQNFEYSIPYSFISISQLTHHDFVGSLIRNYRRKRELKKNYFNIVNTPKGAVGGSNFGVAEAKYIPRVIKSYLNSPQIFVGGDSRKSPMVHGLDIRMSRCTHRIEFGGNIRVVSHLELNDNYIFVACTKENRTRFVHSTVVTGGRDLVRGNGYMRRRRKRDRFYVKKKKTQIMKISLDGMSRIACYDIRNLSQHLFRKYLPKTLVKKVDSVFLNCGDGENRLRFLSAEKHLVSYSPVSSGNRKVVVKLQNPISQFIVSSHHNNSLEQQLEQRIQEKQGYFNGKERRKEYFSSMPNLRKYNMKFLRLVDVGLKDLFERIEYLMEICQQESDEMKFVKFLRNKKQLFVSMLYLG